MIPLSWALRNAGHEVLAAVPESLVQVAAGAGIPATSIGDVLLQREHHATSQDATDAALVEHVLEFYVPLAEATVEKIVDVARTWRADMILHPSWDYAAPLAAAACGIPSLFHSWGMLPAPEIDAAANAALAPLHDKYGVTEALAAAEPFWIDTCAPGFARQHLPGGIPMRYVAYNGSAVLEPWLLAEPARPRVCITLGNIPILGEHDNVVATVIRALAPMDVEIVVAAADRLSVAADLPGNVRVERRLPLSQLLPTCALSIHHGGAGSTMTSIVTGLPQLVLPQMCVQYQHARQIAAVGAGAFLLPGELTEESVRDTVTHLLDDPAPARTVGQIRDGLAARPAPAEVAAGLEARVRELTGRITPVPAVG
jgi:L-noviosyl transferase